MSSYTLLFPHVYILTPSAPCNVFPVHRYHKELFVCWMSGGRGAVSAPAGFSWLVLIVSLQDLPGSLCTGVKWLFFY